MRCARPGLSVRVAFMSDPILHVRGSILCSPTEEREELWIIGGRVTYQPPASGDICTIRGFALPGLVDAHCHLGMDPAGIAADRIEEHAIANRDAGALLIRDAGTPVDDRWVADRADLPRLVRAARHIGRPRRYIPGIANEVEPDQLVDAVREQARAGDGWVKLVGDWIDRDRGDLAPVWPVQVLSAAIAAAHEEGARVTAHCFGEESLADFAAAGTDCIEHATGLTEDTIDDFARQGIAIVPTLINIANFPEFARAGQKKFPQYATHMRDLHDRRYATIAAAYEAGVPIYTGTDAGGSLPHGLIAAEVAELVAAGLPNLAALDAATWAARRWLGYAGLEEGEEADLVVYAQDPRQQVEVLGHPQQLVLRGRLIAA